MKDIVIIGAGGFGREVAQLVRDINSDALQFNLLGYIDDNHEKWGSVLNEDPVLGGFDWFEIRRSKPVYAVCATGSSLHRKALAARARKFGVQFVNLIHPSVIKNRYIKLGTGVIVCADTFLSVNIDIGNYAAINPGCSIGHDTVIGSYSVLMWDVTLSGNVNIGSGCEIGSKSVIIQQRTVGCNSIIGAGAVVTRDIPENCTAVGVPAKPIKFGEINCEKQQHSHPGGVV